MIWGGWLQATFLSYNVRGLITSHLPLLWCEGVGYKPPSSLMMWGGWLQATFLSYDVRGLITSHLPLLWCEGVDYKPPFYLKVLCFPYLGIVLSWVSKYLSRLGFEQQHDHCLSTIKVRFRTTTRPLFVCRLSRLGFEQQHDHIFVCRLSRLGFEQQHDHIFVCWLSRLGFEQQHDHCLFVDYQG